MYELLIAIPISIIYVGFIFYMGKRIKYSRTLFYRDVVIIKIVRYF